MDLFLPLLAQDKSAPVAGPAAKRMLERLFERYPPEVSIPVFVLGVILATWLIERVAIGLARRMAAKTSTKIDDAFVEGIPSVLRPLVVLITLHVLLHQFLHDEKAPSKLTPEGDLAAKALMVVSIIVLAVAVVRGATRMIDAWTFAMPGRHAVGAPIKLCVKVGMVPIALLAVLQAIDYPIASLVTALGIGSLAVGLALQDTLKNMFAGIQIVLDQPIRAGDFVEVDKNVRGTVIELGLRSTKLRSMDNNVIVLPNATIANAVVVNFDVADRRYIQTLTVPVAYGSDTRRVQTILEELANQARKDIPEISDEPARVALRDLGDSALNFTFEITVRQYGGRAAIVAELYHRIYERLRDEKIEVPFPTRTVYLRQDAATAVVTGAPEKPSR